MEALSVVVQVASFKTDRQARVQDGADPSSFRAARLVGAADRHALLDRRLRAGDGRPLHLEAEVSMTPVSHLRRAPRRAVRPRRLGAGDRARAGRRRRGGRRLGRRRGLARARPSLPLVDLATADWSRFAALVLSPGVPLTHPEAALDGRARARGRRRGDRRHRAFRPRARGARARRAARRHHRHQRQVDDDGADRPHPARGRAATSRSAAISACRCSTWRRPRRAACMSWSARRSRSTSRPR